MAGRNFTKLEVNVVKLSLHDKFLLKFQKSCPVSAQRPPIADRSLGINVLFCPLQFNRRHETEKPRPIFLTILGIHSVLRFGDAMGSAVFSEYVLKNKKDKSKNVSSV